MSEGMVDLSAISDRSSLASSPSSSSSLDVARLTTGVAAAGTTAAAPWEVPRTNCYTDFLGRALSEGMVDLSAISDRSPLASFPSSPVVSTTMEDLNWFDDEMDEMFAQAPGYAIKTRSVHGDEVDERFVQALGHARGAPSAVPTASEPMVSEPTMPESMTNAKAGLVKLTGGAAGPLRGR